MVTHYVEDFDGKRNSDAVDPAPEETPASFVEDVTAKVVEPESKSAAKKTSSAKTKG